MKFLEVGGRIHIDLFVVCAEPVDEPELGDVVVVRPVLPFAPVSLSQQPLLQFISGDSSASRLPNSGVSASMIVFRFPCDDSPLCSADSAWASAQSSANRTLAVNFSFSGSFRPSSFSIVRLALSSTAARFVPAFSRRRLPWLSNHCTHQMPEPLGSS